MTVRSTYALNPETVRTLDELARRWNVSKSEALRRAIRAAGEGKPEPSRALRALDALQRSLKLTPTRASRWAREARGERQTASARRESRR
mgnify:FL=1